MASETYGDDADVQSTVNRIYVVESGSDIVFPLAFDSEAGGTYLRVSDGRQIWDFSFSISELGIVSAQDSLIDVSLSESGEIHSQTDGVNFKIRPLHTYKLPTSGELQRACWLHSIQPDTVRDGEQWEQNIVCAAVSPAWYVYSAAKCVLGPPVRLIGARKTLRGGRVFYDDCKWLWWNAGNGRAWYVSGPSSIAPKFPQYLRASPSLGPHEDDSRMRDPLEEEDSQEE